MCLQKNNIRYVLLTNNNNDLKTYNLGKYIKKRSMICKHIKKNIHRNEKIQPVSLNKYPWSLFQEWNEISTEKKE